MPPILGNAIVVLVLLLIIFFCTKDVISNIRNELKGGSCAGCKGGCSGSCGSCSSKTCNDRKADDKVDLLNFKSIAKENEISIETAEEGEISGGIKLEGGKVTLK